jgi:DNA repair protein RadD
MFQLRPYQADGVERLRKSFRDGRRAPLFVLPTGGGKTAVFSYIARNSTAKSKRVLILVHRHELLMQASRSLSKLSVPHGLISPKYSQSSEAVQIASVQTVVRRLQQMPAPDLIVIDEAHHAISSTYRRILDGFPKASVLGVTATPCRTDGAGLGIDSGGVFDDIVIGPSISELIGEQFLVRPEVYAPPIGVDITGVHKKMGDYDRKELGERIDKPRITGCAVAHYQRLCSGLPAIAFCVSVMHAERVAEEFRAVGIKAVRVDGGMRDLARREAIQGLGNGSVDILTSADLIGEGVDIPRVAAAILLRPTQSLALYLQQVGRALRPYEGKSRALILDHVGNCMRHGFPDDDRLWELDPKRRSGGGGFNGNAGPQVQITQCEGCFFVFETGPEYCPKCGILAPQSQRQIDVVDGELKKLSKEEMEAARKQQRREIGMAKTLDELIAIGKQRGYKNPRFWAEKVFGGRGKR